MITNWAKCLSCSPYLPSATLCQFFWLNSSIKIDNKSVFIYINFVGRIFHENGKAKPWHYIKSEYNLESKLKYRWIQLRDALPKLWKDCILMNLFNEIFSKIQRIFVFLIIV